MGQCQDGEEQHSRGQQDEAGVSVPSSGQNPGRLVFPESQAVESDSRHRRGMCIGVWWSQNSLGRVSSD